MSNNVTIVFPDPPPTCCPPPSPPPPPPLRCFGGHESLPLFWSDHTLLCPRYCCNHVPFRDGTTTPSPATTRPWGSSLTTPSPQKCSRELYRWPLASFFTICFVVFFPARVVGNPFFFSFLFRLSLRSPPVVGGRLRCGYLLLLDLTTRNLTLVWKHPPQDLLHEPLSPAMPLPPFELSRLGGCIVVSFLLLPTDHRYLIFAALISRWMGCMREQLPFAFFAHNTHRFLFFFSALAARSVRESPVHFPMRMREQPRLIFHLFALHATLLTCSCCSLFFLLQESFSANEPCAGLEELFSKTSLDANGNILNSSSRGRHEQSRGGGFPGDGAQFTPGLSPRSGRDDGGNSSVGTPYGGSTRGGRGDRSFSFGAETPRTPRDSGAATAAAAAAQSPLLADSSSSRMMMGGWRLDGEESGGGGGLFAVPHREGGSGFLMGGGIDFSTPAAAGTRPQAGAGAAGGAVQEEGSIFDGLGEGELSSFDAGGSSLGGGGASGR